MRERERERERERNEGNKSVAKKLYLLNNITNCSSEESKKIRKIRNEENIRKYMYTEHEITLTEHVNYINKLKTDKKQIVFCVLKNKIEPVGVVSINSIDYLHRKTDWAFYLTSNERTGLGAVLEYYIINFIFSKLEMEKVNCEVIETNNTVVELHKKFFFEEEGIRKENIIKNNRRINVYFLGLTKNKWLSNHHYILEKYERLFNKFEIIIDY
jgi:UDP-4-amino-4,6-dideoxy-N-acetyl-beta-L-altrosamine N-acetyltransferase